MVCIESVYHFGQSEHFNNIVWTFMNMRCLELLHVLFKTFFLSAVFSENMSLLPWLSLFLSILFFFDVIINGLMFTFLF